jgi:hypothetical protein
MGKKKKIRLRIPFGHPGLKNIKWGPFPVQDIIDDCIDKDRHPPPKPLKPLKGKKHD